MLLAFPRPLYASNTPLLARNVLAAVLLLSNWGSLAGCNDSATAEVRSAGTVRGGTDCTASGDYVSRTVYEAVEGSPRMIANGFPVWYTTGPGSMHNPGSGFSRDLAPALVSGTNEVVFAVAPAVHLAGGTAAVGGPGGVPVTGPARFRGWVCGPDGAVLGEAGSARSDSAFAAWRSAFEARWAGWVAMEDSLYAARPALADSAAAAMARSRVAAAVGVSAALDSARAWAAANPVAVAVAFERAAGPGGAAADGLPSWDAVLRDAPVIPASDGPRLRAFATELRGLFAGSDTTAAARAIRLAYERDYLSAGGASGTGLSAAAFDSVARANAVMGPLEPFETSDVRLRPWAGGRVWELYREGASGLLVPEGGDSYRPIYVGEGPGGELRVVWANL